MNSKGASAISEAFPQYMRTWLEAVGSPLFVLRGRQIVACNQRALEMMDVDSVDALIDRDFTKYLRLVDLTQWPRAMEGKQSGYLLTSSGEAARIELSVAPYPVNHEILWLVTATEQREYHLLRTLIDSLTDPIFAKDLQGRFTLFNTAFLEATGLSAYDVLYHTEHELDPARADEFVAEDELVMRTGEPIINIERLFIGDDGQSLWMTTNKFPLRDEYGRMIGLVGITRDITTSKRFEQEMSYYGELLENMSEAVVSTDLNFNIVSWNPGAEALYGWAAEEVIGRRFTDVVKVSYSAMTLKEMMDSFFAQGFWRGEVKQTHRDGTELAVMSATSLLHDQEGKAIGTVVVNRDITDRKLAEQARVESERLKLALETEQELSELRSQLMVTLSHEFRTPLATILSSVEMVQRYFERMTPEKRQERMDEVARQVWRLTQMLDDMGVVLKGTYNHPDLHLEEIDVAAESERLIERIRTTSETEHRFILKKNSVTEPVRLDRELVERILMNLLSNAVKYSEDGTEITLVLERLNDELIIEVIDQGVGIPPEEQSQIFDPFFRGSQARMVGGGTGLGLRIVHDCVRIHGGSIAFESEVGVGTRFTVRLPILAQTHPVEQQS